MNPTPARALSFSEAYSFEGTIELHISLMGCQANFSSSLQVDYEDVEPFAKIKVPGYAQPVEFGVLTSFAYKLEQAYTDAAGKKVDEIVVATTRPETMIGDTGIAVHPDDPRWASTAWHCSNAGTTLKDKAESAKPLTLKVGRHTWSGRISASGTLKVSKNWTGNL